MPSVDWVVTSQVNDKKTELNNLVNKGTGTFFGNIYTGTVQFRGGLHGNKKITNLDIARINSVVIYFNAHKSLKSGESKFRCRKGGTSTWLDTEIATTTDKQYSKAISGSFSKAEYYNIDLSVVAKLLSGNVKVSKVFLRINYTLNEYTVTVKADSNGSVTGGGSYTSGSTATLTATPNDGYVFSHWSDGNTSATRTITVTSAVTYTAYFVKAPRYVTYDSIFNFQKWKNGGITPSNAVVSNITDTGFTLTSNANAEEGTSNSHYFPVTPGKSYKVDIDIEGDNWDVYIFFCNESGSWVDFVDSTNRFSSNGSGVSSRIFTAPNKEEVVKAQIRVDANGSSNSVSFDNFRIYPSEYEYMGDSVSAEQRSNYGEWNIPTPVRKGYEFLGWNTNPEGNGTAYTESSVFPEEDTVLYSQWKRVAIPIPEFNFVGIEYTPPLPTGESFVFKAEVIW